MLSAKNIHAFYKTNPIQNSIIPYLNKYQKANTYRELTPGLSYFNPSTLVLPLLVNCTPNILVLLRSVDDQ